MSQTQQRLVTCALILACAFVWSAVLLRRLPRSLAITLQGFGTNHEGIVFAHIIVSNIHGAGLDVWSEGTSLPAFEDENFFAPSAKSLVSFLALTVHFFTGGTLRSLE